MSFVAAVNNGTVCQLLVLLLGLVPGSTLYHALMVDALVCLSLDLESTGSQV